MNKAQSHRYRRSSSLLRSWNMISPYNCCCSGINDNTNTEKHYSRKSSVSSLVCYVAAVTATTIAAISAVEGFDVGSYSSKTYIRQQNYYRIRQQQQQQQQRYTYVVTNLFAPPGSGYVSSPDDHKEYFKNEMPDTYEPMMAYPGTMRPGKTPENMPFQDLPIGDDDPDPVPWPHFQQIEWHHRWSEPPHEHPGTMEDFIESLGRWASPEQEAAMRAGVRRDLRQRQETVESEKRDTIITDDDDDDDEYDDDYEEKDEPVALGDGIFGKLGSDADRAATAAAVSPDTIRQGSDPSASTGATSSTTSVDDSIDDLFADDDLDDFLLDLGLDAELDDDGPDGGDTPIAGVNVDVDDDIDVDDAMIDIAGSTGGSSTAVGGLGIAPAFSMDADDEFVDASDIDDDDEDSVSTVPLEDFGDSDNLDVEDIFDEGGFDYDDGDFGGNDGDIW